MSNEEILEIEKHFTKYNEGDYIDARMRKPQPIRGKYFHNYEDYFHIIIFEDGTIYQLNSDHELQGIELKSYNKLVERFESFCGERMDYKQR